MRIGFGSMGNSVGTRLLRVVFGLYFIVTFVVTGVQLASEFFRTKDALIVEMEELGLTFAPGISNALWNFNESALKSTLSGLKKIDKIVGIKILDKDKEPFFNVGTILLEDKTTEHYDMEGALIEDEEEIAKKSGLAVANMFDVKFDIYYTDEDDGSTNLVGYGTIYSGTAVVVQKVQYSFFLIIINSVIKTTALWIIFLFFVRKFVGVPLDRLSSATQKLNPRNSDFLASTTTMKELGLTKHNDEIGILSRSFDDMRSAILQKIEQLVVLNQFGEELAKSKDRNTVFTQSVEMIQSQLSFNSGSVFSLKEGHLDLLYSVTEHTDTVKEALLQEDAIKKLIEHKTSVYVSESTYRIPGSDTSQEQHLLFVPLIEQEDCVGVTSFFFPPNSFTLNQEFSVFFQTVARVQMTALDNLNLLGTIEEYNRELERKVEERTSQLQAKTRDIQSILENVPQGIFTVLEGGMIHSEYSKHLEEILINQEIAGSNIIEAVFTNSSLGTDTLSQLENGLYCMIGEDEMVFDFNEHTLIREFEKTLSDGRNITLEVDWNPVLTEDDVIEKIMVTLRDVTELRKAQAEAEEQQRDLNIIGEIISVSQDKFNNFIENAEQMLEENDKLVRETTEKDESVLSSLFRNMHTIKGNARTYGFLYLTHLVHDVEQMYMALQKKAEHEWDQGQLLEQLEGVKANVEEYKNINTEKLGRTHLSAPDNDGSYFLVSKAKIEESLTKLQYLNDSKLNKEESQYVKQVKESLLRIGTSPIDEVLSPLLDSLPSLAKELGTEPPVVDIKDHNISLMKEIEEMLKNTFLHLFRNSMTHGIELPAERDSLDKSSQGKINIELKLNGDQGLITYRDDGRGLGIGKIKNKAIENGLIKDSDNLSPEDLSELVFHSGFSTADQITEISGRGVGLDAVRKYLEEEEGSITINLLDSDTEATHRPFEFHITLPKNCFVPLS